MNSLFAKRLYEIRAEFNLTQSELAVRTKLSQAAISLWEKNKRLPDIDSIQILAEFFNVSADYLIGLTDDDFPQWSTTLETPKKASSNSNLSPDEVEVLDYLRQLPQSEKDAVIDLARQQASKFGYKQEDKE